MGFRTWIYHETKEPQIIDSDDVEEFEADGWRDSPAPFVKIADFNVDADDATGIQQLGDSVQGVADQLNGALNIDEMDNDQLEDYALEHFGIDIDKRLKVTANREAVKAMIDGNS